VLHPISTAQAIRFWCVFLIKAGHSAAAFTFVIVLASAGDTWFLRFPALRAVRRGGTRSGREASLSGCLGRSEFLPVIFPAIRTRGISGGLPPARRGFCEKTRDSGVVRLNRSGPGTDVIGDRWGIIVRTSDDDG